MFFSRLSWGTCESQVPDQDFAGPAEYTLVLSAHGPVSSNYGHDTEMRIRPAVPDAWRFDDAGCQTGARLTLDAKPTESCPVMRGANPLPITAYFIDADGSVVVRLAVAYDDMTTIENQRYVLWNIGFDHTHSIAGVDSDPATCDGAGQPLNFSVISHIVLTSGTLVVLAPDPADQPVTWNHGSVRTQPVTWGRVKALYR